MRIERMNKRTPVDLIEYGHIGLLSNSLIPDRGIRTSVQCNSLVKKDLLIHVPNYVGKQH